MQSSRVFFTVLLCCLAVLAWLLPDTGSAQPRKPQGGDEARQGEDNLDDVLRRFGPEAEGLKAKIDEAIEKGVDWLLKQQKTDGSFDCYQQAGLAFPMGGTALPALALKKSIIGLYEGDARDLKREISKLERLEKSGKIEYIDSLRLKHLREKGEAEVARREAVLAAVHKSIDWIRNKYDACKSSPQGLYTYDVGVTLMLLEGYYTEKQETKDGYVMGVNSRKIPKGDLDWIREMVNYLAGKLREPAYNAEKAPGRAWRYPGDVAQDGGTVDNSNTQYAVLGLKAGSRMGVDVPDKSIWKDVAEYFIAIQDPTGVKIPRKPPAINPADGKYFFPPQYTETQPEDAARGWGYLSKRDQMHPTTGAMTTAALAALVMAQSQLHDAGILKRDQDLAGKINRSLADGMAWLGKYFAVDKNPLQTTSSINWHYYYLYGLERAGVLCQTEYFGEHPWYLEGAKYLVGKQNADGHWLGGDKNSGPPVGPNDQLITDTCFALLFLKRATMPVNVPPVMKPVITGEDGDGK